jgi:hypothetical protein
MDPDISGICQFFILLHMKNKDIFDKLQETYAEGCVSYTWVGKWAKAFREGLASLADDPRSGRPPIPDGVGRIRAKVESEPYQSDSVMGRDPSLSKTFVLEVLKKVLKPKNIQYVAFHALSRTMKKLPESQWQPQCWAFSNH